MKDQYPLVIRGQGDYRSEYWGGEEMTGKPCKTAAVVRDVVAMVQRKASALQGRAGLVGQSLQIWGPSSALRELKAAAKIHDDLGKLIEECGEQLDQEVGKQ